jgi:hypothetical protein
MDIWMDIIIESMNNWNYPQKKVTSKSDKCVRRFTAHLEPKILACVMNLTMEERDALQYESKV